jgi:hypothetical protein
MLDEWLEQRYRRVSIQRYGQMLLTELQRRESER